jgi:very-short-patch-repair endonuclease
VQVAGFTVNAVWPAQRLIVELDGYAFHGTRAAFERDRARDAELQRAGYRVVRLTWRRLHREPAAVAASLHGMLASIARPWRTA